MILGDVLNEAVLSAVWELLLLMAPPKAQLFVAES